MEAKGNHPETPVNANVTSDSTDAEAAKHHTKIKRKNGYKFKFNSTYMTISLYTIFVLFCGTIIFMLVRNWRDTKHFIYDLCGILSPFFIGLLIAYFLSPIVEKINGLFQKYLAKGKHLKLTKFIAMILSYILVIGFLMITITFVLPQIGESITELTNNIPEVYRQLEGFIYSIQDTYPDIDTKWITEKLNEFVPNMVKYGTNLVGNIIPMVFSLSVSIVRTLINLLLALIISVYMINGKPMFREQAKRLVYAIFNEQNGDIVCKTCRECNDIFSAFLISKAIDSLIIGCICFVVMSILRLPYTVLISVIVGITNMIPYFGPFIGAVPGILIYLCTSPKNAIIFAIMIFALQQFDGLVLGPRLLGQSTGLNPIWVIFGITVGGAYFGVIGMFIGVPIVAVIAFLLNKIISYKLKDRTIKALEEFRE